LTSVTVAMWNSLTCDFGSDRRSNGDIAEIAEKVFI